MPFAVTADTVPLQLDATGVVRVGGTRVTLDTVVECYGEGLTAEAIAEQYPAISLGDIYATLAYYLRHKDAVEEYLAHRRQTGDVIRREARARYDQKGIRERLLARQSAR